MLFLGSVLNCEGISEKRQKENDKKLSCGTLFQKAEDKDF